MDAPLIPKDRLWGQFPKGNAIVRMELPLLHNCRGVGECGRHFPSPCLQPSSVQLCGKLRPDASNPTTGGSSSPPAHANSRAQMQLWRFSSLVQWGASLLGMCETGVQFSKRTCLGQGGPSSREQACCLNSVHRTQVKTPNNAVAAACNPSSQAKDKLVMRLIDLAESVAFRPVRDQVKM